MSSELESQAMLIPKGIIIPYKSGEEMSLSQDLLVIPLEVKF